MIFYIWVRCFLVECTYVCNTETLIILPWMPCHTVDLHVKFSLFYLLQLGVCVFQQSNNLIVCDNHIAASRYHNHNHYHYHYHWNEITLSAVINVLDFLLFVSLFIFGSWPNGFKFEWYIGPLLLGQLFERERGGLEATNILHSLLNVTNYKFHFKANCCHHRIRY